MRGWLSILFAEIAFPRPLRKRRLQAVIAAIRAEAERLDRAVRPQRIYYDRETPISIRLRTYTGRILCTDLDACRRREKRRPAPEPNPSRKELHNERSRNG